MRGLTLVCLWAGLIIAAALHFGWTDQFHLAVGAGLLVPPGAMAAWMLRRQTADDAADEEELTPHPARLLLIHLVCAGVCVGYLLTSFHLLHAAGYGFSHLDDDRVALEEKLKLLEDAKQFDRAADLIQERLGQPLSNGWERTLAERLYRNLLDSGQQCKELPDRRERFKKAFDLSRRHQLDGTLALRLDEESVREQQFLDLLAKLQSEKDWPTLVTLLDASLAEDVPGRRHLPVSDWLRDRLLDWAGELKSVNEKKQKLTRALEVCGKYGLDQHAAKLALELLEKEVRDGQRPASLPHGATGGIVRLVADYYPPAVIADVWIDHPDGRPVEKLREKEFQVHWNGRKVPELVVHEEYRPTVPLQLIVAIDTSGSMKGPPIVAAQEGAKNLVRGLQPLSERHGQMWIQVLTFHSEVTVRSAWTKNMLLASSTLEGLRADGGTALYKTVARSVHEFRGRPGQKHLLLFTDGKDTDGGIEFASLVAVCKQEKVVVSTIGLRSSDLDEGALRRLASETGGSYAEASGPEELLEQFRQAAARVRPHFYRLVFLPPAGVAGPLEIRIGGENSLLLKDFVKR
jgi:Mg-chelatase subunit ChlD